MRLLRLLLKIASAAVLGIVCAVAPLAAWVPAWVALIQMPVAVVVVVTYCGKLLYDTLFYDHYRP